jgi:hypothetical protein
MNVWKQIPLQNCGGNDYIRDASYALPGWFMAELRQMATCTSTEENRPR